MAPEQAFGEIPDRVVGAEFGTDIGHVDAVSGAGGRQHLRRQGAELRRERLRRDALRGCPLGDGEKMERIGRRFAGLDAPDAVGDRRRVTRPVAAVPAIVEQCWRAAGNVGSRCSTSARAAPAAR